MPNTNEYLKQLTANDDQQTFSDKSNYNFAKLLDLSGATNNGGDYTLLPGTKGDTGDIGNRGNYIYSKDDPATILPTDLIDGDVNISALTTIISQYEDGTLPIWNNIININALITDAVNNIPPGSISAGVFSRLIGHSKIITVKRTSGDLFDDTLLLHNFDLSSYPSVIYDYFNKSILSLYPDTTKDQYNLLIGATNGSVLSTIDDSLKISYIPVADKATADFDLSFTTTGSASKNTGFVFKTNDMGIDDRIITTIGGKTFIGNDISGISISNTSYTMSIGLMADGNSKISTDTTNLIFTTNLVPSQNATYSLGSLSSKIKDLYLSGNIESDNIFIGETATSSGIHYKSGKVGINTLVDNYESALTIMGDLEFALNSHNLVYIKTQESKSAYDHSGGGMALHINAGKGGDVGPPPSGVPTKPSATHGGDITISGGAGGESTQYGVTGGKGGTVHIYGGNGGSGNPNGADGNVIIGNEKRNEVIINSKYTFVNSKVGIEKQSNILSGLDIGSSMGFSIIESRSSDTTNGNTVMYNIVENVGGVFTISDADAVEGRVIIIKDGSGTAGNKNILISPPNGIVIDLIPYNAGTVTNPMKINKKYGYVWLLYSNKTFYTISHYGIII